MFRNSFQALEALPAEPFAQDGWPIVPRPIFPTVLMPRHIAFPEPEPVPEEEVPSPTANMSSEGGEKGMMQTIASDKSALLQIIRGRSHPTGGRRHFGISTNTGRVSGTSKAAK